MNVYLAYCSQYLNIIALNENKPFNITKSFDYSKINSVPYFNNKQKLSKQYNETIKRLVNEDCILVLAHDDVVITDKDWINKLHIGLQEYDVVGLAGTSEATIRQPCLWHLMSAREKLTGTVNHVNFADNSTFTTHFGKPGRALILDGLFLAFNPKKIAKQGIEFDETNPCIAHFYDIDFSLTCNKHQLTMGTINIQATHSSPGLKSFSKDWLEGQDWFLNKYSSGGYYI
jgi:hypothetical protein